VLPGVGITGGHYFHIDKYPTGAYTFNRVQSDWTEARFAREAF